MNKLLHPAHHCLHSSHLGWCVCSRAASGANACEWPTHGNGAETTVEPQGPWTKEEELKSLLMAAGTTDLHSRCWLCKLSVCGISKWMSAPAAGVGLAPAAVGFVGMYTQGLGWARI